MFNGLVIKNSVKRYNVLQIRVKRLQNFVNVYTESIKRNGTV